MLVPTEKVSNPSDDISTHFEVLHVAEKYAADLGPVDGITPGLA
jgi:hypothetical protein